MIMFINSLPPGAKVKTSEQKTLFRNGKYKIQAGSGKMVIVYLLATSLSSPPVEPITLNNRGEVEEQTDGRRRRGRPDARLLVPGTHYPPI